MSLLDVDAGADNIMGPECGKVMEDMLFESSPPQLVEIWTRRWCEMSPKSVANAFTWFPVSCA